MSQPHVNLASDHTMSIGTAKLQMFSDFFVQYVSRSPGQRTFLSTHSSYDGMPLTIETVDLVVQGYFKLTKCTIMNITSALSLDLKYRHDR